MSFKQDQGDLGSYYALLFADYTTLQMSNQDAKTLLEKVNSALALANKLTLHQSKTKYICFSAGQHTELKSKIFTLNGVAIEKEGLDCETKWFKFLGMCLGQHAHVYQKACLKRTVPHRIRMLIYNSDIQPYFEYCIKVWGVLKSQ